MNKLNTSAFLKSIKITLSLALLTGFTASAQDLSLNWVNKNAHELQSDSSTDLTDLSFLKKELKGKDIVGLGEGSHGTKEFYNQKARVIRYLIEHCGFRTISFEVPEAKMMQINQFVQTGEGDLKEVMTDMGLYGSDEIYQLFLNLAEYNKKASNKNLVKLNGFDKPDYWSDPFTRDGFMAENVAKFLPNSNNKIILWAHNVHISKDTLTQYWPMGGHLKKQFSDRYFAIAVDTYKGSVNVLNQGKFEAHDFQTNEATLSGTLSKAKYPSLYLRFNVTSDPFKGASSQITNIYSNWQELKPLPIRPGVDMDAVIFIRSTTPSTQLSSGKF